MISISISGMKPASDLSTYTFNADDPKQVLLWFDVADPTKARQAIQGDEIKEAMKEAGVVGHPKIHAVMPAGLSSEI